MTRGRAVVLGTGVVAGALLAVVSRAMSVEYGKTFAMQSALVIADYLAAVAPAPRGMAASSKGYDVGQLLAHARALDLLPPWTSRLEVYHGTAPLVHSTAAPLTPDQFGRLRRFEAATWLPHDHAVLVPLTDRERWDVLGAVKVVAIAPGPGWWLGLVCPVLLVALGALVGLGRGVMLEGYWGAGLALAVLSAWRAGAIVGALKASWTEAMHGLTEGHAVAANTIPLLHLATTAWTVVLISLTLLGPVAATVVASIESSPPDSEN